MGDDCRFRSKSEVNICSSNGKQELVFNNDRKTNYLSRLKHRKLYTFGQVPAHLQSNSFILDGYRHDLSWSECIASFFLFHNETLNVWTHFIGLVLFIWYLFRDFISVNQNDNLFSNANIDDYLIFLFYVLAIIYCMAASTMLHLLSGCSAKLYSTCLQLDLLGIAIATVASFFIGLHLIFKCHFYTRIFYQLAIILLITIVVMHHVLKFDDQINSTSFIAIAISGFIPTFHWVYVNEYNSNVSYFFCNIIIVYLLFGAGVFFFRTRIPERLAPGYFDYVGASHQLWHIFSLFAFYWWYKHSIELIKHHQTYDCTTAFATFNEIN